ncbi:uncharacterized protein Z518_04247 [Rhinocladiella mackenziei CBS 650.93]|uniref:Uncharacterized protein n=1 Tax=Rhinocladiella mackenziei CBS 650.93 TaxID=1442369 RepID=A0A0D2FVT3_9EURO|nr:uncharacterized protein Z518_04247 [Rhinocladiella mackenziei CBS 650.93]KIX06272.1 hypothetical protein Z518_04247 [Rhinocladiella mackenziei CBS 650.93]
MGHDAGNYGNYGSYGNSNQAGFAAFSLSSPLFPMTLTFQPSQFDPNTMIVQRMVNGATIPSYSITKSKNTLTFSRIDAGNTMIQPPSIGSATIHSLSSNVDISLFGHHISMKCSQLSGNYTLTCPPMRKLKWENSMSGSTLKLIDTSSGSQLVKLKKDTLQVFVPCDDFLLDLIVISGTVAGQEQKKINNAAANAAGDVISAVVGV